MNRASSNENMMLVRVAVAQSLLDLADRHTLSTDEITIGLIQSAAAAAMGISDNASQNFAWPLKNFASACEGIVPGMRIEMEAEMAEEMESKNEEPL